MRRPVIGAFALLMCAAPVSAAKFTMQLNASAGQTSRMQSGVTAIDDSSAGSSVRLIQAEGDLKKRGQIQLLVMNQGDRHAHEMLLYHPSKDDPKSTTRQFDNLMDVIGTLRREGENRQIGVRSYDSVPEIAEHILELERSPT
jgi:hypothetical protein